MQKHLHYFRLLSIFARLYVRCMRINDKWKYLIPVLLMAIVIIAMDGCSASRAERERVRSLRSSIRADFIAYRIDSAISKAYRLNSMTSENFCREDYLASLAYLGQGYLMKRDNDSIDYYFGRVRQLAEQYSDNWSMATMYNCMGIYYRRDEADADKAIKSFLTGLPYAYRAHDDILISNLKANLATTYYMRNDPDGLVYALDIYDIGDKRGDKYLKYNGAFAASYMYYMLGRFDSARYYVEQAIPFLETGGDKYSIWVLYGDILTACGEDDKALEYYSKAMSAVLTEKDPVGIDVFLSYGRFLKKRQMYDSSLFVLQRGILLADSTFNNINRYQLFKEAADVCMLMGDEEGYEYYMENYERFRDVIFNYEKEREISDMELSYLKNEYEQSLHLADKRLVRVLLVSLCVIVLLCLGWWGWHRRKEKALMDSLKSRREAFLAQNTVYPVKAAEKQTDSPSDDEDMSDPKMAALFMQLENLMKNRRVYADRNITREKLAELLSTNRTYVTKAVHAFTGMNLAAYINKFRIEEAVRVLSDISDTRQNKEIASDLGFSSVSNFYKLFSAATGISPAQFKTRQQSEARQ